MSPRADLFLGLTTIPNVLKADGWYRRTCRSGTEFVSPLHPTNSGQLYCSITTALGIRQGLWLKRPALLFLFLITPECWGTRNPVITVHWGQVPLAQSMAEKGPWGHDGQMENSSSVSVLSSWYYQFLTHCFPRRQCFAALLGPDT